MTPLSEIKRPPLSEVESTHINQTIEDSYEALRKISGMPRRHDARGIYDKSSNLNLRFIALGRIAMEWRDYANQLETECAERDELIEELRETITQLQRGRRSAWLMEQRDKIQAELADKHLSSTDTLVVLDWAYNNPKPSEIP